MLNHDSNGLEQAAEFWRGGQSLAAGRLIFENLPTEVRPKWASRILRLVIERSGVRFSPIEQVLRIADHAKGWRNARGAFSALRKATLDLERLQTRSKEQNLLLCHLYLAENVAKVIYNATDPPDEFDEDSGWWVVSCLKSVLDLLNDDQFSKVAWSVVCSE
jgi:hypothetical protein